MDQDEASVPEARTTQTGDASSIWHVGTPAEAIQSALTQGKLFLVWVSESPPADGDQLQPTSTILLWNTIWEDAEVKFTLSEHAVSLKLEQGTPDAAMFLQLVGSPPQSSGAWIVFAGQLLDSFSEPPTPDEMHQRLHSTISKTEEVKQAALQPSQPQHSASSNTPSTAQNANLQAQLAARRAKLEAAKLQYDKDLKESRKAANARHASSTDPERQKYISQQAKERQQQKSERAKILAEIENDKAERKARAERERKAHSSTPVDRPSTPRNAMLVHAGMTKVSIRQPDSKVLKGEFAAEKTLADVRIWVDENRTDGSNAPYVLQTTFPTRTFEVSEEQHETLGSIFGKGGQCIMKEIKTYSEAYSSGAPGVVGLASSLLGTVTGTLSNVLGFNGPATPATPPVDPQGPGDAIREARIRNVNYSARERGVGGGMDSSEGDDREKNWFNGNGLAQEAPPRNDEKKD